MALLPLHKYFVFNNEVRLSEVFIPSENEGGVYEVLRVAKGIPLFLEDHLDRFFFSAQLAGKTIPFSKSAIELFLQKLIEKNEVSEGNILISCKTNLKAFFIPHNYPTHGMYRDGVICGILKAERENPNAKVFQTTVRQQANKMLEEKGYYEVMLVDHFGRITEGSRSNVFFVQQNSLVTPPGGQVLLGITRQKTLQLARELLIPVHEKEVSVNELHRFEAAFITGTSPKILPIRQIDGNTFNPENTILRQLMTRYDEMIGQYVAARL
jgi:branched-chain amino acid aminotransferase